jgi:undecaprenyl-diphosphatase
LLIERERPPVPTVGTTYATSSFPSGHVASAVVLYGGIALLIGLRRSPGARAILLSVAGLLVVIVAAGRMYTGFHFPTDCIAGALFASMWLAVVYRVVLLRSEVPLDRIDRR